MIYFSILLNYILHMYNCIYTISNIFYVKICKNIKIRAKLVTQIKIIVTMKSHFLF